MIVAIRACTSVGMMARMCAYACRHDHYYECMYMWAPLCLCTPTRAGTIAHVYGGSRKAVFECLVDMIAPMCAYAWA